MRLLEGAGQYETNTLDVSGSMRQKDKLPLLQKLMHQKMNKL